MRIELEAKRGAWFDRARKDVERVVQRAIKRAEEADAALEAEFGRQEQKAEEYAKELAKIDDVRAENELLAMAAAKAQKAAEQALMEKVKIHEELNGGRRRSSTPRRPPRRPPQPPPRRTNTPASFEKSSPRPRRSSRGCGVRDAARAEAEAKTRALANQQAVNAGVMRMKNAMEWRVLEMQAALEKAGAAPPSSRPSDGGSSTDLRWTGVGLPPHPRAPRPSHPSRPPTRPTDAVERRERDSNHPGLRAVAAAPVRPQGRDPAAGDRRRSTNGRRVHRSAAAPGVSDAASFARFRAMFPDLQTPEEMDDLAALDALDVAGARRWRLVPNCRADAHAAAQSLEKGLAQTRRKRADGSIRRDRRESTAAPLIAKGNGHASYGATAPAGPGSSPESPGPSLRRGARRFARRKSPPRGGG